jgi:hypothetical protein
MKDTDTVLYTQLSHIEQLHLCGGCKIVHYCNKVLSLIFPFPDYLFSFNHRRQDCQKAAWNRHHKFECATYAAINKCSKYSTGQEGKCGIYTWQLRMIVRLVELHRAGRLDSPFRYQWKEFERLPTCRTSIAVIVRFERTSQQQLCS